MNFPYNPGEIVFEEVASAIFSTDLEVVGRWISKLLTVELNLEFESEYSVGTWLGRTLAQAARHHRDTNADSIKFLC
jgi:hypothetical protein